MYNCVCMNCDSDTNSRITLQNRRDTHIDNETHALEHEYVPTSPTSYCSAYERDTLIDNDSKISLGTVYNISTACNSVHDVTSTPLQAHNNVLNLGLHGRGMHIGHINVRGIRSGEKMDQIKIMLHSNENDISMLGVSESKLGVDVPDSLIEVDSFQVFRKDKIQGSGGLLVYVKNDITCSRRKDLENEHFESIWTEMFPKNSKAVLIGHFYRNPASTTDWNEIFDDQVEKAAEEEKEIFLLGDFNKDLLNPQIKTQWLGYMNSHGMSQHVNEATRVVSNVSSTLIDHIYSNFSENIQFIDIPKIGLRDHYPIFFTRKVNARIPKATHHTIKYRSFKNFDEERFNEDLKSIPWDVIKVFDTADDALDTWYSLFSEVVDKHIPLKQHRVKKVTQPSWLTPEIIDAIKSRDHFKAIGNNIEFKKWRNKVVKLIKQSKKLNYEKIIEEGKNQPTTIWKMFNELGGGKRKSNSASTINSLKVGNSETDDPAEIANGFNDFFINIADNIKEPTEPTSHEKLKEYCKEKIPEDVVFDLPMLTKDKVIKYLKHLDIRKSTGTDDIGPRLLRMSSPIIAESLTYICNLSIKTGSFPERWKEAKVKPLLKGGPSNDPNNFRPISILPVLSKLFEKHVHEGLINFLEKYKLLHDTQSGFRRNHSCETALIHMVEKWLKAFNNGELVGVIFVDFRKAFDLVDHDILMKKLELYKFNQVSLNWFRSYLSGRKQIVSFKNVVSERETVKCGVPQGSILGPLLFLLFINDLPLHIKVKTDLYADDATVYEINNSKEEIERKLQLAIKDLTRWCKLNGMTINTEKTKAMLVTTRQRRSRINDNLNLSLNNIQLLTVSNEKVLGVQIDNNLSWGEHVRKVTQKMSTNIWLLSKVKNYLSNEHRVMFYKSYIQPHLDYANIVWSSMSKTNLMQIERLQKRACRIILDYNCDNVYHSMDNLKIMTISERIFFRKAKFMFKVSKGITPEYINEMFTKRQDNRNANDSLVLRSVTADNFILPKPNTELYKGSLAYSGPVIWNCLNNEVKSAPSTESFHNRCIKWLKA